MENHVGNGGAACQSFQNSLYDGSIRTKVELDDERWRL